jgi:hypothetical protein
VLKIPDRLPMRNVLAKHPSSTCPEMPNQPMSVPALSFSMSRWPTPRRCGCPRSAHGHPSLVVRRTQARWQRRRCKRPTHSTLRLHRWPVFALRHLPTTLLPVSALRHRRLPTPLFRHRPRCLFLPHSSLCSKQRPRLHPMPRTLCLRLLPHLPARRPLRFSRCSLQSTTSAAPRLYPRIHHLPRTQTGCPAPWSSLRPSLLPWATS